MTLEASKKSRSTDVKDPRTDKQSPSMSLSGCTNRTMSGTSRCTNLLLPWLTCPSNEAEPTTILPNNQHGFASPQPQHSISGKNRSPISICCHSSASSALAAATLLACVVEARPRELQRRVQLQSWGAASCGSATPHNVMNTQHVRKGTTIYCTLHCITVKAPLPPSRFPPTGTR